MAYIIQQRRDTLTNWNAVNPVLTNAELGFILDLDENGKQKSSMYKIGDGRTPWNELPLFGFGGNVYDDFNGDDLNTSVASRHAVIEKIGEIVENTKTDILNGVVEGDNKFEGLLNKLSKTQLVQRINIIEGEDDLELNKEALENQIPSRYVILIKFNEVIKSISDLTSEFGDFKANSTATVNTLSENFNKFKEDTNSEIDSLNKFTYGWDENKGETTVHHKGVDEKLEDLSNKIFNIISEQEFENIQDFSQYPEGTLFFTYNDEN